jgi:hypothetical protein
LRARQWIGAIALVWVCGCSSPIGEEFRDVDAIAISNSWKHWVVIGKFGGDGPFRVIGVKSCQVSEPCSFSHNGAGHTYEGFTGYEIKVLRLEGANGEVTHVVLRSEEKQDG